MDRATAEPEGKKGLDANAGDGELLPARLMTARWHNDGDSSSACLAGDWGLQAGGGQGSRSERSRPFNTLDVSTLKAESSRCAGAGR
jgi:hypothetical protein